MLEIACFNGPSAILAAESGADRIELCADYAAGGVTPPIEWLDEVRNVTDIPVHVMVRPRGGDFVYNDNEFEQMENDLMSFKSIASGFVFGLLDTSNNIDAARNRHLVRLAAPLPCTFHRAIDGTLDLDKALEQVIDCGFHSVLTSGGGKSASDGADTVAGLQKRFGQRISIIVGGGIRSSNLMEVKRSTVVPWFHSAAITQRGEVVDSEEIVKMQAVLDKDI